MNHIYLMCYVFYACKLCIACIIYKILFCFCFLFSLCPQFSTTVQPFCLTDWCNFIYKQCFEVFLLSVYDFFNKSTFYFQLLSYSVIHSFVEFSVIYYIKVVWLMINSGEQLRFQSLAKRHPLNSATRQLSLEQSVQTVKKEMLRRQQCRPTYTCPSSWAMV